ncbi:MAG: hypothetical protein ACTSRS_19015 [Candidatus Helarchaeota archaeon]
MTKIILKEKKSYTQKRVRKDLIFELKEKAKGTELEGLSQQSLIDFALRWFLVHYFNHDGTQGVSPTDNTPWGSAPANKRGEDDVGAPLTFTTDSRMEEVE